MAARCRAPCRWCRLPTPVEELETKETFPSVDQILDKFVAALGGEQAVRKVTSRVITGTQYIPTGPGGGTLVPAAIERDQKAPNLVVTTYHTPTYTISAPTVCHQPGGRLSSDCSGFPEGPIE